MITTKTKFVLVLISLLLIGVIVYLSLVFIKHKNTEGRLAVMRANYKKVKFMYLLNAKAKVHYPSNQVL